MRLGIISIALILFALNINAVDCNKVVSGVEDPSPAQIAGGTLPAIVNQMQWLRPSISTYRAAFSGVDGSTATHEGVDYVHNDPAVEIVDIFAAADGKVVYVREGCEQSAMFTRNTNARESGAGWGNHIVIEHKSAVFTRYAHLLINSALVNVGDSVKMGQKIAVMGNSGRSEVRHLHFEIGTRTAAFDPCAMSQNFDRVYNAEDLAYINASTKINLISPVNNAVNVSPNAVFVWEKEGGSTNYTIEIATDINFANIIATTTTPNDNYIAQNLPVGSLYWRVKSDTKFYSDPQLFNTTNIEGFEHCLPNGLPGGWARYAFDVIKGSVTNNNAWQATNVDKFNNGSFSAKMPNYQSESECSLLTPVFSVNSQTPSPTFWRSTTTGNYESTLDIYYIEADKDAADRSNYQLIRKINEGNDNLWYKETVDVSALAGKNIRIALKVKNFGDPTNANAGGDNWWVDDFFIPIQSISSRVNSNDLSQLKITTFNGAITISNTNLYQLESVSIVDLMGRIIKKIDIDSSNDTCRIDTNELNKGLYILNITINNTSVLRKILI